jgi:hypothetical protein
MYVGPLQSGGEGFSFAYAWGPLGSRAGGSIEIWPDTYFKSGYVAVQNPAQDTVVELWSPYDTEGGIIETRNYLGGRNTYLGTVNAAAGGLSGTLALYNNEGNPYESAGINGKTGDVWGQSKSFIVPHPKCSLTAGRRSLR